MKLLLAQPILDQSPINRPKGTVRLGIVLVGTHPASELYVGIKQRQAAHYGIAAEVIRLAATSTTEAVQAAIREANDQYAGVIIQLPLPDHLPTEAILDCIDPRKDVDNLTGQHVFTSPMVQAVQALCKAYAITIEGKSLCVIGQGRLVGGPLMHWLQSLGCHPVIVDEATANKDTVIHEADIVFGGSGHKYVVHAGNTRSGQIIFDCSGRDVDFDAIKETVAAITPPKGGIGPLTVHFLLMNVITAATL